MEWFRFYSEVKHDSKMKRLARDTNAELIEVVGAWALVLCTANESPERGRLMIGVGIPMTIEDIADALDAATDRAQFWVDQFTRLGLLRHVKGAWEVAHWDARQFPSDNSTPRVRKHRETFLKRSGNSYSNASVTPQSTVQQPTVPIDNSTAANAVLADVAALLTAFTEESGVPPIPSATKRALTDIQNQASEYIRAYGLEALTDDIRSVSGERRSSGIDRPKSIRWYFARWKDKPPLYKPPSNGKKQPERWDWQAKLASMTPEEIAQAERELEAMDAKV